MKRKMLRIPAMFLFAFIITSCGTSKAKLAAEKQKAATSQRMARPAPPQTRINTAPSNVLPEDNRVYKITTFAREFEGTPYKYGGTTREGMDCSGLVYTSFLQENIPLPRSSKDMAHLGERLSLVDVNIGDLLFFETNKNKKVINHVGLVVEIQPGHIFFIHSSSSRGVIISSLADTYWFDHFIMARRVI